MKLTVEEHPERITRYNHIKPAPIWGAKRCSSVCRGTTRSCTLEQGHRGPHVAHGTFRKVLAVWDSSTPAQAVEVTTSAPGSVARHGKVDAGLTSPGKKIWDAVTRVAPSMEAGLFLVFFIGMVAFFIDWALRLAGIK